jgi:hypothetical protein
MQRRRLLGLAVAVTAATALPLASSFAPVAAAGDGDGSKAADLAEAQFRVFLLANTDLHPTDVTCTDPPSRDPGGDLLCFALVSARDSVAAVATLTAPGQYTFTPLNKVDLTGRLDEVLPGAPTTATTATEPVVGADAAILATVNGAVANVDELAGVLEDRNPMITGVDGMTFDEPTGTLSIAVTSSAATPADRDVVAFDVTDTLAYLWETDTPLRAEGATIQPRFEASIDGTLYSTPYPVMVQVADYQIGFNDWLQIATTAQSPVRNHAPGHAVRRGEVALRAQTAKEDAAGGNLVRPVGAPSPAIV